jgi:hypothetical protein
MKVARSLFAVLLATALSGCAQDQAQQRAAYEAQQRAVQLIEQNKAASQEYVYKFSTITPQNAVAAAQCGKAAMAINSASADVWRSPIVTSPWSLSPWAKSWLLAGMRSWPSA